jgi:hypothetical protein
MGAPARLIEELATQLRSIADWSDLPHIARVELAVGDRYQADGDELAGQLETLFETDPPDSKLEGAAVAVRIVSAGESFPAPGRSDWHTATGWELLVIDLK